MAVLDFGIQEGLRVRIARVIGRNVAMEDVGGDQRRRAISWSPLTSGSLALRGKVSVRAPTDDDGVD